jgi:hypothetical protein
MEKSENIGSDQITISNEQLIESCSQHNYCVVYVGVFAYEQSMFTVTVSTQSTGKNDKDLPIMLEDGIIQFGRL